MVAIVSVLLPVEKRSDMCVLLSGLRKLFIDLFQLRSEGSLKSFPFSGRRDRWWYWRILTLKLGYDTGQSSRASLCNVLVDLIKVESSTFPGMSNRDDKNSTFSSTIAIEVTEY